MSNPKIAFKLFLQLLSGDTTNLKQIVENYKIRFGYFKKYL